MLEPLLKHLLSLRNLLLPQIQLSSLRPPLCVEELNYLLQLTVGLVESRLCLAKDFFENVFKLVDFGLIFNGLA